MKKILFLFLIPISFLLNAQSDLESFFRNHSIDFEKIESPNPEFTSYVLYVEQQLDHNDIKKGVFKQKIFLNHRSFDAIMIMGTEGYQMTRNRMYEPTNLLQANQISVEHRFFGESLPENMEWEYLTLEQATTDLHKIRVLFGKLYGHHWVSTGISKGGQTTIAYRYFYPNDVTVSIPYVAPLNNDIEDKRIYKFLDNVGTDECRKKIKDFQKALLKSKNRKKIMPLLKWYVKGSKEKFTYFTLEEAYEYAVLEYSFSFWQLGYKCEDIPEKNADVEVLLEELMRVVGVSFYSDELVSFYGPHYYQAATQMGYYSFETRPFRRYIKALPKNPTAAFLPNKMKVKYDDTYNTKVTKWLAEKGDRFIYIYGEIDTWSATMVEESDKVDSEWFVLKNRHHGDARIMNFNTEEKLRLKNALEKWLRVNL